jgi:cardiolipin synthase
MAVDEEAKTDLADFFPEFTGLSKYLEDMNCPVYKCRTLEYFPIGEDFFEPFKADLKRAKKFILIEFFIFDLGSVLDEVLEILRQKSDEGVTIKVMYDGMGSQIILPPHYERRIAAMSGRDNIQCRVFNPIRPLVSTIQNNRDHRIIVVIDGEIAYTGGVNLADEYMNRKRIYGKWKDSAVRFTGEGVWSFTVAFFELWNIAPMDAKRRFDFITPDVWSFHSSAKISYRIKSSAKQNKSRKKFSVSGKFSKPHVHVSLKESGFIIPYTDSPQDDENVGQAVYLDIINRADSYVYITTPYLVLDHEMFTALTLAAKRGTDVRIILPKIQDKIYMQFIARSYYKSLIRSGVKIYEYTPGFIHAKSFVSDNIVATVGSVNLDYRSLFLHYECGVLILGNSEIKKIRDDFLETVSESEPITLDCVKNYSTR